MCYYLPPRSCQLVRREHTALDSLDHSLLRIPAPKAIQCPISPLLNPRPCQTSQTKGWARQLNFPMWAARQLLWLEHLSVSIYLHWSSDFQLDLSEQRNNLGGRKVSLSWGSVHGSDILTEAGLDLHKLAGWYLSPSVAPRVVGTCLGERRRGGRLWLGMRDRRLHG